jgi:hypothetical protein
MHGFIDGDEIDGTDEILDDINTDPEDIQCHSRSDS